MAPHPDIAFGDLRRALERRRFASIDLRLKIEIALLAAIVLAFVFWRMRIQAATEVADHGPLAAAGRIGAWLALIALIGAGLASARYARLLMRGVPGPQWLSLPASSGALRAHLEWEARTQALWVVPLAPGVFIALWGLVPWWWIALMIAGFIALLRASAVAACALAFALAARTAEARDGCDPMTRILASATRGLRAKARPGQARWRRGAGWRALWHKDVLVAWRAPATRRRFLIPIALGTLAAIVWRMAIPKALAHFIAFALSLAASGALGEWLIELCGQDPFALLRSLPVGVGSVWCARAVWPLAGALTLVGVQAVAARTLSPEALGLFLIWIGAAALLIALLGVNFGITLFPQTNAAQRLYSLALGIAIAASLMIPLLGWVTLLTAFLHSARRLSRWSRLESTP